MVWYGEDEVEGQKLGFISCPQGQAAEITVP